MEVKILAENVGRISKQRNLFLLLSMVLAMAVTALSLRLATFDQRIIMVPGIGKEMSLGSTEVSIGYLEETAMLFLSHLLDISSGSVRYKRQSVLKYTSFSDPAYAKAINEYFADVEEKYAKFDLSTHFTVKNLRVDPDKKEVTASGVLSSIYGKKGHDSQELSYRLSFEYNGGFLRLKEFVRLQGQDPVAPAVGKAKILQEKEDGAGQ